MRRGHRGELQDECCAFFVSEVVFRNIRDFVESGLFENEPTTPADQAQRKRLVLSYRKSFGESSLLEMNLSTAYDVCSRGFLWARCDVPVLVRWFSHW